jgi:hypothetical protein
VICEDTATSGSHPTIRFWLGQSSLSAARGEAQHSISPQIVPPDLRQIFCQVQVLYTPVELNGAVDVGKCFKSEHFYYADAAGASRKVDRSGPEA